MNGKTAAVLLSALLAACVQTPPPQVAASSASSPPPAPAAAPTPPPAPAPSAVPAAAPAQPPAAKSAPTDHIVNIREISCQNLLRLSPEDRAAAAMFYVGYQASRYRARTINVSVIPSIEAQAVTYCQENPNWSAAQAFAQAYLRTRS
jgi:HdeA/HdeB family